MFWKLISNVRNYKKQVTGNIICNIFVALFTVVSIPAIIPFFEILFDQVDQVNEKPELTFSIDSIVPWAQYQYSHLIYAQGKETALFYFCAFIVILFLLKNLFRYLSLAFLVPVRNGIVRDLRTRLYDKTISLSMGYFSNEKKGDLIARFSSDVQEIEHSVLNVLEVVVKSPLIIIGSISIMLIISPGLTIFVFILIVFTVVIIGGISRALKRQSLQAQNKLGSIIAMVDETIAGLKIIKGFSAESFFSGHFYKANTSYKDMLNRILWRRDLSSPLSEFLGIAVVSVLLWYGSNLVVANELLPGTFIAFIYAFFSIIEPSKSFSKAYYHVLKGLAAVERVEQVMQVPVTIKEAIDPVSLDTIKKGIVFDNVWFKYSEEEVFVLKNINLEIPVGKTIAVVGSSGSGKTTLIDLLNRFYDIYQGHIFIDHVDIRSIKIKDLRNLMAIVSQDPIVFNDTIYNNIIFGSQTAGPDDVESAARIANAHDFIVKSENGYQTIVGDRGVKLSGGQRQRITLARAILKQAPLLILDEATSALDSESEREVQRALRDIAREKTVIVIAHRLSTIQHADIIYVLKDGQIIETGKHNELMDKGGEYKKFVELQAF